MRGVAAAAACRRHAAVTSRRPTSSAPNVLLRQPPPQSNAADGDGTSSSGTHPGAGTLRRYGGYSGRGACAPEATTTTSSSSPSRRYYRSVSAARTPPMPLHPDGSRAATTRTATIHGGMELCHGRVLSTTSYGGPPGGGGGGGGVDSAAAGPAPDHPSTSSGESDSERLERMEREMTTTDQFNEVIVGYAELGDAAKAEEILLRMESMARSEVRSDIDSQTKPEHIGMPDVDSYTAVLDSWVSHQADLASRETAGTNLRGEILHAAERADAVLKNMEKVSAEGVGVGNDEPKNSPSVVVRPTSHHYDAVITAWARSCSKGGWLARGSPQRAQLVLDRVEALSLDAGSGVRPSIETYNLVIEAWGNSDEHLFAAMAQAVFDRISDGPASHLNIEPNARTVRAMLQAWSRSDQKTAAFHATGHLMRLQESLEAGVEDMEPTIDDYLTVLEAWAQAEDKFSARRSQNILKHMERLYMKRFTDVRPDVACYRFVLRSMARSKLTELGPKADNLMARMEDRLLVPDSTCFGATIETWSNSACHSDALSVDDDAKMADDVLQKMAEMYHRSSTIVVKPTSSNYNDVIRAYSMSSKEGSAERAEELLDEMEKLYNEGDRDMRPDISSYIYTINAWAQSRRADKVANCIQLLTRANDQVKSGNVSAKPTIECYHAVIKACASCASSNGADRSNALRSAIQTAQKLKKTKEINATSETYKLLIEACSRLLPEGSERTKAVESVFNNCCLEGLVDDKVLRQFQKAASYDVYKSTILLNTSTGLDGKTLPEEWSRKVAYRVRTLGGRKPPPLSVDVGFVVTPAMSDYKMRRLRTKKNQRLLRGGRS